MLRIIIFTLLIFQFSYSARNNSSLLDDQLDALNRQMQNENDQQNNINSQYNYNQNSSYTDIPEPKSFYVGAGLFLGYFDSDSSISAYNKKDSTTAAIYKFGYIFKTNNRIELNIIEEQRLDYGDEIHLITGGIINLILTKPVGGLSNTYFTIHGGVGLYDYSHYNLEGISLNPALGITTQINNIMEVDAKFLYQYTTWMDLDGDITHSPEIKSTIFRGFVFGVKYKF